MDRTHNFPNRFDFTLYRINDQEQIEQFRQDLYALNNIQKEDENVDDTIQKRNEYIQKTIQMDIDTIQKGIQKVLHERQQTITELQLSILLYFAKHPLASRKDYINDTEGELRKVVLFPRLAACKICAYLADEAVERMDIGL